MVADGERLYGMACVACHGPNGAGTQLGPSHRDTEWIHVDGGLDGIVEVIRTGVPAPEEHPVPMPPLGGGDFDDEQVRALAAYVYSLSRR
jgi:mono/diheme cytochrome c family protein